MQYRKLKELALLTAGWMMAMPLFAGEATNSIGMKMVDIPEGSFVMGGCAKSTKNSAENERRAFLGQALLPSASCMAYEVENESSDNEGPQRQVSVGKFQLSKTEVTLGQFKQFIAESGRSDLLDAVFMEGNRYGNNAPVLRVSWRMAQDFVAWLNAKEGGGYRLPSEAEWEYACRAGGKFKYCGSNKLSDVAWFVDNSGDKPHPVATKKPNAFGLYDMSGNAREWVQDCHRLGYRNAPATGGVWPGGDCDSRMKRGGSWDHEASGNRAADRDNGNPGYGDRLTGFRVARST